MEGLPPPISSLDRAAPDYVKRLDEGIVLLKQANASYDQRAAEFVETWDGAFNDLLEAQGVPVHKSGALSLAGLDVAVSAYRLPEDVDEQRRIEDAVMDFRYKMADAKRPLMAEQIALDRSIVDYFGQARELTEIIDLYEGSFKPDSAYTLHLFVVQPGRVYGAHVTLPAGLTNLKEATFQGGGLSDFKPDAFETDGFVEEFRQALGEADNAYIYVGKNPVTSFPEREVFHQLIWHWHEHLKTSRDEQAAAAPTGGRLARIVNKVRSRFSP